MARRTHTSVTIREGTSEKYWYTIAGYLTIGILGILYFAFILQQSAGMEGGNMITGYTGGMVIILLSFIGLGVYPALFKDSAYLRGTYQWKPKWWYYVLAGVGTPVALYFGLSVVVPSIIAATFAIIGHAVSASGVSAVYLYKRHQHVGIP